MLRRSRSTWPALLGFLVVALASWAARTDAVLVVRPDATDAMLTETFSRLCGELRMYGFAVLVSDREDGASASEVVGGVSLFRAPGQANARIWIADSATGKTILGLTISVDDADAPSLLAMRAADLLRASLRDFERSADGKAKMLVASRNAAQAATGISLNSFEQQVQTGLDEVIAFLKSQLGLSDDDVIPLPATFGGFGVDLASVWSNPVDSVYIGGTLMVGATRTPAAVKADVERRLSAIGVRAAWVDDSEYADWLGNVRSATNTSQTPVCANFTDCLP